MRNVIREEVEETGGRGVWRSKKKACLQQLSLEELSK
jgi:hypothetical protein